jgi:hypothetical protein
MPIFNLCLNVFINLNAFTFLCIFLTGKESGDNQPDPKEIFFHGYTFLMCAYSVQNPVFGIPAAFGQMMHQNYRELIPPPRENNHEKNVLS